MTTRRPSVVTPKQFNQQWEAAEIILERIKHSCYRSHILYKHRYLASRDRLTYFDVPIIVFSSVNSVLIAGGKNFINEDIIEITTCMLALATGIIQALRTFFKVDENRENCLTAYKDLFRLFCEISIILDQPRQTRGVDPQKFMADKSSEYKEIISRAIVLEYKKAERDPIYHDRHPWMKQYDMAPEVGTPKSAPDFELGSSEKRPMDIGLPLLREDSVEIPALKEPTDSSEDDETDSIPPDGVQGGAAG
uniref:VP11 n=1 Tax=viral metagenome TaxID=1070528 RepID=A0A2V0RBS2_9ZZZZ